MLRETRIGAAVCYGALFDLKTLNVPDRSDPRSFRSFPRSFPPRSFPLRPCTIRLDAVWHGNEGQPMRPDDERISDDLRQMCERLLQLCERRLGERPDGPRRDTWYRAAFRGHPVVWLCAIGIGQNRNTVHLIAKWDDRFRPLGARPEGPNWYGTPSADLWTGPAQEAQAVAFINLAIDLMQQ